MSKMHKGLATGETLAAAGVAGGICGTATANAGTTIRSGYDPISCEFHDLLEAHATTRKQAQIRFRDGGGAVQDRRAAIVDVFAREGAEYISLSTGETVRLDQLIVVDNARLADF